MAAMYAERHVSNLLPCFNEHHANTRALKILIEMQFLLAAVLDAVVVHEQC